MPIRTLEFPIILEPWQQERIEFYFNKLKNIWNIGLARLEDLDRFSGYYNKETKSYNPCCPVNWEYRRYWLNEDDTIIDKPSQSQKGNCKRIDVPFSRIVSEQSKYLLKELPQVKIVVPAAHGNTKGKTTAQYLQHSEKTGKPIVVTTSRLLNFGGVVAIDGCSGFSCPLVPCEFFDCSSGYRKYYTKLKQHWFDLPIEQLPIYQVPLLSRYEFDASGGLGLAIKKENLQYRDDKDELLDVPYKFRSGTIKALSTSWQEYDKSRKRATTNGIFRGKPKFKSRKDKITTLVHPNPKGVIISGGKDILKGIPELGKVRVPGLNNRWRNSDGSFPGIATFKICQCASGWYVQLTGELDRSQGLRESSKAIAGDPGLINYITFDDGKEIQNPRFWRKAEEKLARLQKQLSHKRSHNLILWLNHPNRVVGDIRKVININIEDAQALLSCKTEQDGKALISQSRWNTLMFRRGDESKAIQQLENRIKRQHENIRRMRRSFAHRLSTWLVQNYEIFVCEDGIQKEQLRHKSGIKLDENDVAQKNQKAAKAGLTKSLSDAAHGQLLELCAQKFKEAGRTFIRYPARNTTLECPICGTHNNMGANCQGQRYLCSNCNWESGRDQKPGILMLVKLYDGGKVPFESLSEPTKEAIIFRENWKVTTGGCFGKRKTKKTRAKAG